MKSDTNFPLFDAPSLIQTIGATPMTIEVLKDYQPLNSTALRQQIKNQAVPYPTGKRTISQKLTIQNERAFTLDIDGWYLREDSTITIRDCHDFHLKGHPHLSVDTPKNKFFIEIINCTNFYLDGILMGGGRNGILIHDSSDFHLERCRFTDLEGTAIALSDVKEFSIAHCSFENILSAAVLIVGNSHSGYLGHCTCKSSRGYFNHDAAFHLCCTSNRVGPEHIPDRCHESIPITAKNKRPHRIIIERCIATHCRAQGVYLEGAVNCLLEKNLLLQNTKEGICFDWGSCYNIFRKNSVSLNGERKNLSPSEIKADFISHYPLLDDNSSSMKLPGISMDNGCGNIIQDNIISSNFGGGIKLIRSALYNTITNNRISYNTLGANKFVPFVNSITILGLGAENDEFDTDKPLLLDFLPSVRNTVRNNIIHEHLEPIFRDKKSLDNSISDNLILPRRPLFNKLVGVAKRIQGIIARRIEKLKGVK